MTHHLTTRNPQSEARRQQVHGKLVSDEPIRPRKVLASGALAIVGFCAWAYWFAAVTG